MMNNINGSRQSSSNNGADALPILAFKDQIMGSAAPYLIVEAETGSGKSTMVPQWYHEQGLRVLVTEPLIETVIGTSEYVAQLMDCRFGGTVGYRTAKARQDSAETQILFCTDGLALVRELAGHNRFDVLIIDELHEWNTNQSTLEAWAWKHIQDGDSVFTKIVVLSATLDSAALSRKRGNAPIFKVPGRQFPIIDRPAGASIEADIAKLVGEGFDVLCFQPGKAEIEKTVASLFNVDAELIPFHGQLERSEKDRAYKNYGRPKVVVSTNALETGRTLLPSTGRQLAVVDSGLERRVELVEGIEGLYLKPIAKARGLQRRGRTGRVGDGVYIDHCAATGRPDYPVPEILRTRPDQTVLRLAIAGYDAVSLPFFQELSPTAIADAKQSLVGLGAFDHRGQVTPMGQRMVRLPVDIHIARMVLEAERLGVVDDIVTIAACLAADGIRDRSGNWKTLTQEKDSDLLAERDCFDALRESRGVDFREAGIFGKALFRAREIRRRLADALRLVGVRFGSSGDRTDIIKAICAGMVDHLYRSQGYGTYRNGGSGDRELARESVLKSAYDSPEWIVGQPFDLEITNRRGRKQTLHLVTMATKVDPSWLLEVAPQLSSTTRRNYLFSADTQAVMCDLIHMFNGQEVKVEKAEAERCEEATKALAAGFAQQLIADPAMKALNAELTELQAKSAGATRGALTQSEIAELLGARLGNAFTLAEVAERDIDLTLPRTLWVADEAAQKIREENPDTVTIGDEVCPSQYEYVPAYYTYSPAKQTVTIKVSVATVQAVGQTAVESLIPSGVSYVLTLADNGYTAIQGTDVAELRKQIEARRLELAWALFQKEHPATRVEIKGLEPLPELPEPEIYDAVTTTIAFPALATGYYGWTITWFKSEPEASTSQATAMKAKAELDVKEDEKQNRDRYVAEAAAEANVVAELFDQIKLDEYESYGLSRDEAGKGYYSSESLAKQLEQAKAANSTSDGYYSRTPEPKKALTLLTTLRARLAAALDYHARNAGLKDEAQALHDRLAAVLAVERELTSSLTTEEHTAFVALAKQAAADIERGAFVPVVDAVAAQSELVAKAERAKQALDTQVASGTILLNFRAWHRRGGSNTGDGWVIRPDGSRRERDSDSVPRHKHDGTYTWNRVHADELALEWTKGARADPHCCKVVFRPTTITKAQLVAAREIEQEVDAPLGAFGLDANLNALGERRLAAIEKTLLAVLVTVPEFDYQQVSNPLGVVIENTNYFRRRPSTRGPVSPVSCNGRTATVIWSGRAADGIVEIVTYHKYGSDNFAFRWNELAERPASIAMGEPEAMYVAEAPPVVHSTTTTTAAPDVGAATTVDLLAAFKAKMDRRR